MTHINYNNKIIILFVHVITFIGGYLLSINTESENTSYLFITTPFLVVAAYFLSYFLRYCWWSWAITIIASQAIGACYNPMFLNHSFERLYQLDYLIIHTIFLLILLYSSKRGLNRRLKATN